LTLDENEPSPPPVSAFASESSATIKIESTVMLSGYIVEAPRICKPLTQTNPGKKLALQVIVADKIGYLKKTEFQNDYFRFKTYQQLIQDIAGTLGVTSSVSASLNQFFKRSFYGTSCSDALAFAVENGGADWFGDENTVLNAWPQSSPPTLQTGALSYQIQDFASGGAQQIEVSHLHQYLYNPDSAMFRFKNVRVVNNNWETWPADIDEITKTTFWNGTLGFPASRYITAIATAPLGTVFRIPQFIPGPESGGNTTGSNVNAPAVSLTTGATTDQFSATFWYVSGDNPVQNSQYFKIPAGAWDQLRFQIYTNVDLTLASQVKVSLIDQTTGEYYYRNIKGDLNGSNVWTAVLYQLPTTTSGAAGTISNGWTKNGALAWNKIDTVLIEFFKTSTGTVSGWPVGSNMQFAMFYFARRLNVVATSAGGLNTTKSVVNNSIKNASVMATQATMELARSAYALKAECTIPGNTDFKRPGYLCNVNFNQTFGNGHSGTLRIDKARHYTDQYGFYWVDLEFAPSLQRL